MSNVGDTDQLVEAYLGIRSERERLLREYEIADSKLKEDMNYFDFKYNKYDYG